MKRTRSSSIFIVIAVIILIAATSSGVLIFGSQKSNTNQPTPSETSQPVDTKEPVSEPYEHQDGIYNPDEFYSGVEIIDSDILSEDDVSYYTSESGEDTVPRFIDAEDFLTVTIDMEEDDSFKLYVISHEKMLNPFNHPISDFQFCGQVDFLKKDGQLVAEYGLGYGLITHEWADFLIVKDGKICARIMLIVTQSNASSINYWRYKYPQQAISTFTISFNGASMQCFYLPNKTTSMRQWITSDMNVYDLRIAQNYLVDSSKTFMVELENNMPSDGSIINAEPYDDNKIKPFEFKASTVEDLVFYLDKSSDVFINRFGEPNKIEEKSIITLYEYSPFTCYFDSINGLMQIVLQDKNEDISIIDGLPGYPVNSMELVTHCLTFGIEYPESEAYTDDDGVYHCTVTFHYDEWYVSYVWELDGNAIPANTPCTKIVIHNSENILF